METEAEEAKRARPRPSWSNDDTLTQLLLDARDDDDNDEIERCPEDNQNVFSAAFFGWLSPMLVKGSKKPLEYHDMPVTSKRNRSARTRMEFDAQWRKAEAKHGKKDPSLLRVLAKSHWPTLLIAYALKLVQIIVNFARPIILEELLVFLTTRQVPQWLVNLGIPPATLQHTYGYALAVLLALCAVGQSIFQQHFLYRSQQAALRVVNSLMSAIFAKSLKLNAKSRSQFEQGQIINLIGADTGRLYQFIGFSMDSFWSAPVQIVIAVYMLVRLLGGIPLLCGLSVLLVSLPLTFINGIVITKVQKAKMRAKDDRVSKVKEAVSGIKLVKSMAWEEYFKRRIADARATEVTKLLYGMLCYTVIVIVFLSVPLLIMLGIFGSYVLLGNTLTAVIAFPAISILNQLRVPLTQLPDAISRVAELMVSLRRIERLLVADELPERVILRKGKLSHSEKSPPLGPHPPSSPDKADAHNSAWWFALEMIDGTYSYGSAAPILTNIDLSIKRGEFVAVGGPVGAGKTSLLLAMLGEMECLAGKCALNGTVSYVAQEAFVINATMRENICFGLPHEEEFYNEVVEACSLTSDFAILEFGDLSEIGESGVNISGGQKQRVSLARAVYRRSDIYLFDDPLSAVDAHVAEHIYQACILGLLKGRTRVLITHGLQFMKQSDRICMMRGGTIKESGTYKSLTKEGSSSDLAELDRKYQEDVHRAQETGPLNNHPADNNPEEDELDHSILSPASLGRTTSLDEYALSQSASFRERSESRKSEKSNSTGGGLMTEEKRETGNVAKAIYITYLKAAGGVPMIVAVVLVSILGATIPIGSQYWISEWCNDQFGWGQRAYLNVFACITCGAVMVYMVRGLIICFAAITAAKKMHGGVVDSLMRTPISFYHTTPQGRIMNRCSSDMEQMDEQAAPMMGNFINQLAIILGSLVSVVFASPWFAAVLPICAWLYLRVGKYYVTSSRETKRLSSIAKSPVYKHFGEAIQGATTIRAYGDVPRYERENIRLLDEWIRSYWPSVIINRWLSVRLDCIGALMTFGAAFAVFVVYDLPLGLQMDPGKAGFAISQTLQITGFLGFTVMIYGQLEMTAIAIERIAEYCELPEEPPEVIEDTRPPENWPSRGMVEIKRFSMSYRVGLPLVLNKITLTIHPQEKVGICGRTGAGKSSVFNALLRLCDYHTGKIVIDGLEIHDMGVKDLRRHIAIITQESIMFIGTIRYNLDPAGLHSDAELHKALRLVGLTGAVKLDDSVVEDGSNLSGGQKQLLCVARAILRGSKIVLLDEATASVDVDNDQRLQTTIRKTMSQCTVLTVAHRIHTISDSTRIMVLDNGRVAEMDAPRALMNQPESIYKSLVDQTVSTSK